MLVFRKGIHYRAFWFLSAQSSPIDVMAGMFQEDLGPWQLLVRVRSSTTLDPWDQNDRKSWRAATLQHGIDVESGFQQLNNQMKEVAKAMSLEFNQFDLNTDDPDIIIDILGKQPWFHMKITKVKPVAVKDEAN